MQSGAPAQPAPVGHSTVSTAPLDPIVCPPQDQALTLGLSFQDQGLTLALFSPLLIYGCAPPVWVLGMEQSPRSCDSASPEGTTRSPTASHGDMSGQEGQGTCQVSHRCCDDTPSPEVTEVSQTWGQGRSWERAWGSPGAADKQHKEQMRDAISTGVMLQQQPHLTPKHWGHIHTLRSCSSFETSTQEDWKCQTAASRHHGALCTAMGQPAGIWGTGIRARQSRAQQHCGAVLGWIWHHSLRQCCREGLQRAV